jgi:uncharacterized membrane protein YeaQ/YmgE (transglycosylase-associated protein family)
MHLNAEGRLEHDPMTWRSRLGVVATFLVGVVGSVLTYLLVLMFTFNTGLSWTTIFVWFTVVLSAPTIAWWRTRDRYGYSLAFGLVAGWAMVGALVLVEVDGEASSGEYGSGSGAMTITYGT